MSDPDPPAVPPVAVRLGALAVVPFVCGAALVWLVDPALRPLAAQMLSAYAAVVVSFIGAIHWGLGFAQAGPATTDRLSGESGMPAALADGRKTEQRNRVPAFAGTKGASGLFVWGVVPSLVACVAVLIPPHIGLGVHSMMLVVCYLVDTGVYRRQAVGNWLPLRLRLTVAATASCLVGLAGTWA